LPHGPCLDRPTGSTSSTNRRWRRNEEPCVIAYSGERHLATKFVPWQPLMAFDLRRHYDRVAVPRRASTAVKQHPQESASSPDLVPVAFATPEQTVRRTLLA
jgi:hypothetical protein